MFLLHEVTTATVFLIPSDNSIKIMMACSLMVSQYVLLQAIAEILPAAKSPPLIAIGMMYELCLGGFALVCAVVTVSLRTWHPPLPRFLRNFLRKLDRLLCFGLPGISRNNLDSKNARDFYNMTTCLTALIAGEDLTKETSVVKSILIQIKDLLHDRMVSKLQLREEKAEHLRMWALIDLIVNVFLFFVFLFEATVISLTYLLLNFNQIELSEH